mgnify:CR=1 FL=1
MKHPCHKEQLTSLKRIEGQVRGVQGMIEEGQYCVDILNQIKALKNSIITVEGKILKTHLHFDQIHEKLISFASLFHILNMKVYFFHILYIILPLTLRFLIAHQKYPT